MRKHDPFITTFIQFLQPDVYNNYYTNKAKCYLYTIQIQPGAVD